MAHEEHSLARLSDVDVREISLHTETSRIISASTKWDDVDDDSRPASRQVGCLDPVLVIIIFSHGFGRLWPSVAAAVLRAGPFFSARAAGLFLVARFDPFPRLEDLGGADKHPSKTPTKMRTKKAEKFEFFGWYPL